MADNLPWFDFAEAPPVGLRYRYRRQFLTLRIVEPYVRRDGVPSHILHWQADDGRACTSGLRMKDVVWAKSEGGRNA